MFDKLMKLKLSERFNYFEKNIILLIFSNLLIFGCAPEEESKKICLELIQEFKEIQGVNGVHLMGHNKEDIISEIIKESRIT